MELITLAASMLGYCKPGNQCALLHETQGEQLCSPGDQKQDSWLFPLKERSQLSPSHWTYVFCLLCSNPQSPATAGGSSIHAHVHVVQEWSFTTSITGRPSSACHLCLFVPSTAHVSLLPLNYPLFNGHNTSTWLALAPNRGSQCLLQNSSSGTWMKYPQT